MTCMPSRNNNGLHGMLNHQTLGPQSSTGKVRKMLNYSVVVRKKFVHCVVYISKMANEYLDCIFIDVQIPPYIIYIEHRDDDDSTES